VASEIIMNQSELPSGWDKDRVDRVLAHYESQTDAKAMVEDEAAFAEPDETTMKVPRDLVPLVRELIARQGS
jgi:hypothetical protein